MLSRGSITPGQSFGERRRVAEGSDTEQEPEIAADLVARIGRGSRDAEETMVRRYGPCLL